MPTPTTPIRLTNADKAKIAAIRERFGLPSHAAAIRYAVETVFREINAPAPRKKSRKGA